MINIIINDTHNIELPSGGLTNHILRIASMFTIRGTDITSISITPILDNLSANSNAERLSPIPTLV